MLLRVARVLSCIHILIQFRLQTSRSSAVALWLGCMFERVFIIVLYIPGVTKRLYQTEGIHYLILDQNK